MSPRNKLEPSPHVYMLIYRRAVNRFSFKPTLAVIKIHTSFVAQFISVICTVTSGQRLLLHSRDNTNHFRKWIATRPRTGV